jgi:hypothetical protein
LMPLLQLHEECVVRNHVHSVTHINGTIAGISTCFVALSEVWCRNINRVMDDLNELASTV